MKIHEYQAREIFKKYGLPVPNSVLCQSVEEVEKAMAKKEDLVVVKAQVLVGGRGKAGGVKLARNKQEAVDAARQILGMDIKGLTVEKVLVADAVDIQKEFYVGLINDRNTKSVTLMASAEGGVEIEEVAKNTPELIHKFAIDPLTGLLDFQAREIGMKLFGNVKHARKAADIMQKLYTLFVETDATIAEINPLVLTPDNEIWAIDGKMNFDDNALYRQAEIEAMREADEDELKEIDAHEKGLSYVKLDGNIGCMVNGAGLAMATMDMIKLYGGEPANFLDIGGSSNPQKVVDAMNILLSDQNVNAVMINIFGGITRCDDVARGLIKALDIIKTDIPIVVRLSGTNAEEGLALLKETGLPTVATMSEAAQKAIELSQGQ
ncbi:ADP-forming succinate--CoA ligase subunit beta [Sunxiuqinia elliptica]|uniref:Succinate--CoA ligase [ADP-forming] subunit beta n=1 Tax=Sunxiuqinia elliptica TaxID=655355 RepID=A0A4R6H9U1_9BACT|nr:ADP-forming succinate--CoA ligase subunit beta [Sunxiuqinia elliptica]TDO05112.1 succinyl-CoA synthetase beta subunit [Sunxiuqinia elliptica]TDO64661.1 succinyl-CoA synthetase beta subunit [Sunxiuqinia elliptica]